MIEKSIFGQAGIVGPEGYQTLRMSALVVTGHLAAHDESPVTLKSGRC
jgi:hypothetical protein